MSYNPRDNFVTLSGEIIPRVPTPASATSHSTTREPQPEISPEALAYPEIPAEPQTSTEADNSVTQLSDFIRDNLSTENVVEREPFIIPPCDNAEEEWDLREAIRVSKEMNGEIIEEVEQVQQVQPTPRPLPPVYKGRNQRQYHHHHHEREEEEIPKEKWDKLGEQLNELAAWLDLEEEAKKTETDPVKIYQNLLQEEGTVKIYSKKDLGFRILHNNKSEKEQLLIDTSNFEMLKFAYSRNDEVIEKEKAYMDWNRLELVMWEHVENFVRIFEPKSFRPGNLSVPIDFEEAIPKMKMREWTNLLRPVLIDGVAVLAATLPDEYYLPFIHSEIQPIYHETLNLPVKAIFDVIMNFLIRGHKVTAYLPMYYEKFITPGGISKVDDLFAFRKLIELEFIKFHEVPSNKRWFQEMCRLVDDSGSVFVSSIVFRRRSEKVTYEICSERIITPCFLNTEDRLMIIEPKIRYRDPEHPKRFKVIHSKEILQFRENDTDWDPLREQLYLDQQIEALCQLCQLYPTNSLHKLSIKQLLALSVYAESGFNMPFMGLEEYFKLYERFVTSN